MTELYLEGCHAVITGGGTGIGAAIGVRLAAYGACLTLVGRRAEPLEQLAARLPGALAITADVTVESEVEHAFRSARARSGPIAILVNNAGAARSAPIAKTPLQLWNAMIQVNLTGAFLCTRAFLSDLDGVRRGRIVNVASTAALKGYPYVSAYCAAKHGLVGLTRAVAIELAHQPITVNAVCPGYTNTPLLDCAVRAIAAATGRNEQSARAELGRANPQGRLLSPESIAAVVVWLCQPENDSLTGLALPVAGGEVM